MSEFKETVAARHAGGWIVLAGVCLASCMGIMAGRSDHSSAKASQADPLPPFPRLAIDLNTAGPTELSCLEGVGPTLAQRIVDFRGKIGQFRSLDQLDSIPGIGPRLAARIRQSCTITPSMTSAAPGPNSQSLANQPSPSASDEAEHD